jgi:hypothetical protein
MTLHSKTTKKKMMIHSLYIAIVEPWRPSTKEATDDLHNIPYPISKV